MKQSIALLVALILSFFVFFIELVIVMTIHCSENDTEVTNDFASVTYWTGFIFGIILILNILYGFNFKRNYKPNKK